jgi:hypothetical protein
VSDEFLIKFLIWDEVMDGETGTKNGITERSPLKFRMELGQGSIIKIRTSNSERTHS